MAECNFQGDFENAAPIGVFDSGVGGLSVLRALRELLPAARFVYVADSACAPYGERGADFVAERSVRIAAHLRQHYGVRALVIACNTATAAAAAAIRAQWPAMPVVGVEPAIKPAAAATRTGIVAVMATRGTVQSARFSNLINNFGAGHNWRVRACDGLAAAIEASVETGDTAAIAALATQHAAALAPFGTDAGCADTLVLGCTHYVFAIEQLRRAVGADVQILDTAAAVARQTARVLAALQTDQQLGQPRPQMPHSLLGDQPQNATETAPSASERLILLATAAPAQLSAAAQRWLAQPALAAQQVEI